MKLDKLYISILMAAFSVGDLSNVKAQSTRIANHSTLTFIDIARHEDGLAMSSNHNEALKYCADQGAHLPSARELAQLLVSLGAKGFAESNLDYSYQKIDTTNADGSADSFYFSDSGQRLPKGDFGKNTFWTSSIKSDKPNLVWVLDSLGGDFKEAARFNNNYYLCVFDR